MREMGLEETIKTSVSALEIRRQELFSIQDKVPFQSESNNINNLPSVGQLIQKILGTQTSSLISASSRDKEYNHGGLWHPQDLPTSVQDRVMNQTQQIPITQGAQEFHLQQFKDLEELNAWDFQDKYGTNKYTARNYLNPNELNPEPFTFPHQIPDELQVVSENEGDQGVFKSSYDQFKGNDPNLQWITGASNQTNATPGQKQQTQGFHNNVIGTALPIPGLEALKLTTSGKSIPGIIGTVPKGLKSADLTKGSGDNLMGLKKGDRSPVPTSSVNINKAKHKEIQKLVNDRKKYLRSEEYINKRSANTGESPNQIKAQIDVYIKELDNATLGAYKKGDLGKNVKGDYGSKAGIRVVEEQGYKEILGVIDHEVGHLLSPRNRTMISSNPHTTVTWKESKTGKVLTDAEARVSKVDLDFDVNPNWQKWEKTYGVESEIYKNYPKIDMDAGDMTSYLNLPHEQQVRMVRYGEILKKNGWDGTSKGLTNDIINKTAGEMQGNISLGFPNSSGVTLPSDVRQLLGKMKGIKPGDPEWYAQIKKTLPYAWSMAPVAATTLNEFGTQTSSLVKEYQHGGVHSLGFASSPYQRALDRGMTLVSSRRGYDDTNGDYTYYNYENTSRGETSAFRVYDKKKVEEKRELYTPTKLPMKSAEFIATDPELKLTKAHPYELVKNKSSYYTIERAGIGTHTDPKGDDGKPLIILKDQAGRAIFQGSQTEYAKKYRDSLERGTSEYGERRKNRLYLK